MTIYSNILRNLVLPAGDLLFGQPMMQRLSFLEEAQYWSPARIYEDQSQALNALIKTAYNEVPFYRSLMDDLHIKPHHIRSSADLQVLPIVTKDMLRAGYPDMTTRKTGQRTYQAGTSGSTGKNFYIREDAYTAGHYRAPFMLALQWAGWSIGEPHLQTGMTLLRSLDRRLKDWVLRCHYMSAFNLDDSHLEIILNEMDRYHLQHLWGYPGSLYYLAMFAQKAGWNQPLKSIVTWGDSLYPHYRTLIEKVFQKQVNDTYGCAEGIQISAQCEFGNYHIHALDTIVEFLDESGHPVKPGEVGNIVLTRLHPGPMPLIRYAVGDLGVPSLDQICPCGRGLPLMDSIQGRTADVVLTPSGNRLIVHFFTGVLEHFPEIDSFQVVQDSPAHILIRILPKSEPAESLSPRIVTALKDRGASDLDINVEFVSEMPLPPNGKHRFVINRLEKQEAHV